ncbi:MAG: transketolase C-terminal domain-containing protein [Xanthobacteraceae bacterium]
MSTPASNQRVVTYVDALREGMAQEMRTDPRVFLFGLDVDDHKGIQGSTRGLVQEFGPERVFGTPLSEDAMTGVAIGAAMAGMRPVHVHIRMDFLMLAMNQLINIAAKSSYMYEGQVKVPMVVRSMIGKSWGQGAQHSQGLHAMFMHVPGLKVVAPSNAYDAKGALIAAIRDDNPVIFVEHRLLYYTDAFVPEESYVVAFGKARVCTPGDDITVVGISNMLVECLRAHEILNDIGIHAEVIDPVTLVPLDIDTIVKSVKKTGRLLVVDNAWTSCGASAEIVAQVIERAQNGKPIAVKRMGYAPTTCPTTPVLEQEFYPDPGKIAQAIHAMVRPHDAAWQPDPERAKLAYQVKFRGPF